MWRGVTGRAAAAAIGLLLLAAPATRQEADAWQYVRGNVTESLTTFAVPDFAGAAAVSLPHRVLAPNTALWYAATRVLPAGGALTIDADDGAQLFVDGRQIPADNRTFVLPDGIVGTHRVVVRVLNNAMAGGLRAVRIAAPPAKRPDATAAMRPPLDLVPPVEAPAFRRRMPAAGQDCGFSVWGDSQGGWTTFKALVARMAADRADVTIGVGDLVNDGATAGVWRGFLAALAPLAAVVPVVPVAGNHDYDGFYDSLRAEHYLALFRPVDARPWFAWSCGRVRFMAIDVNTEFPIGISPGSAQARWIEQETAGRPLREAGGRVLLVHQPPWSRSWFGYEGDSAVRQWVERLAATAGLDMVFSGHSHAYARLARQAGGRRLQVVITGGAGGALEDAAAGRLDGVAGDRVIVRHHHVRLRATADALSWEAVDAGGAVLDRHTIGPISGR